jgi:O-succinylhomoserine sulfhydrylase
MKRNKNTLDVAKTWELDTQMIRGGTLRSEFGETSEAIFMNSGFCYDSAEVAESRFNGVAPGYVYSRYLNPTLKMLEDRLTLLEGAQACCVMGSGMAAVFASIMCHVKTGDHVIASKVLFGSCFYIVSEILPRFGVEVTLVEGVEEAAWAAAFKPNTTCVFIETPANPTLALVDIAVVAKLSKQHGALLIVDNIFATPFLQKPLELGADVVVYSTTKHMDGGGRTLGGAVLGSETYIKEVLLPFHRHTGPALSPFNAWVILKSLETFSMRMERHCSNALKVAQFLENHPKIAAVHYPALKSHPHYAIAARQMTLHGEVNGGAMVAFEVKGGKTGAFNFVNALQVIDISNNLGDSKSLITHPATTTHSNMKQPEQEAIGITQGMLRLSVGLEDARDLLKDMEQALERA